MNLRRKTLVILGLTLIGAVALILLLSYTVLIGSFSSFEEETVHSSLDNALKSISYELSLIELRCGEWARWDETYEFIKTGDQGYIDRNLNPDSLNNLDIDLCLFVNETGSLVYATEYNKTAKERNPLDSHTLNLILSTPHFFSHTELVSSRRGILAEGDIPILLVSEPVLKSTYEGPPAGILIFGKYLDEDEVGKISEITSLNLTITRGDLVTGVQGHQDGWVPPSNPLHPIYSIRHQGTDLISGYSHLPEIVGNEIFTLQVTGDRRIYNQGLETIKSYILLIIVIGILGIILSLSLLDRLVLKRLNILITQARTRNISPDQKKISFLDNGDELSELSRSLNPVFDDYSRSIRDLRESEQKYRELADTVQHTMAGIITGKGDTINVINPAYALMHGYDPDEIRDVPFTSLFSPSLQHSFPEHLKKAGLQGHIVFEAEHIRRDGTTFPTLNDLTVIRDDGDQIRYWILNVQDITEHRLAWKILMESESLRESHRQLKDVISRLPDATFVIDKDGWVILWNAAMENLTKIPADSIIGRGQYEYSIPFYGTKRPILIDYVVNRNLDPASLYQGIARHGDTISAEEYLADTVNGPMYLSSVASPLYDAEGKVIGAIESIRDISARKRAEDALIKTNEKLNLLSSITRHDIRNRITVFFGVLPILKKMDSDPDFSGMIDLLERAATAIHDQIEFTRDYQDMGVHAPEWADAGRILDNVSDPGVTAGITIENHLHGLFIYADPLLERVFYNLIDNATRHGEHVSQINASFAICNSAVVVSFEDDGAGIPSDLKERVFERGYGKNTGLGLFLVRQILSITGISICETGITGMGARFEMTIPEGSYRIENSL